MQDVCVKISSAGSCRATCATSLYADLLCEISLSVGQLMQDLCNRISCARSLFQDVCIRIFAGPLVEDPLPDDINELYQHSA